MDYLWNVGYYSDEKDKWDVKKLPNINNITYS